jgi:signal transduction histidine kinase
MNYHLSHVSLNELVEEVTESMRPQFQESGIELSLSGKDHLYVIADRYRLEQVLVNLLNNSLKYGLGRPVHVSLLQVSGRAMIKVKDLGVGIPHNQIKRIFGKFERGGKVSSIAGLGLGLYITQEIVRAFNGSIQVKSVEGEWTEFTVTLPIV